jgi:hypothetical protein
MPQSSTLSMGMDVHKNSCSSWMPGSSAPTLSEKCPTFSMPLKKEGLQGGKGDKHEAEQSQHIHDPGIQQES